MIVKLPSGEIVQTNWIARVRPTDDGCTITWAIKEMELQKLGGEDAAKLLLALSSLAELDDRLLSRRLGREKQANV